MLSPTSSKPSSYIMNVTELEKVCNKVRDQNSSIRFLDCTAAYCSTDSQGLMNCNYMSNFNLLSLQFQFLYIEKLFFDLSTKIYKVNKHTLVSLGHTAGKCTAF